MSATRASSIDISKRDLTLDIARVFCVLLVVVIHMLMVGVGFAADGSLSISRPLENQPWFDAATWVGQIMPLFFVVGGFASLTAWRSLVRRGGTGSDYVHNRVLRLAQPALPLFIFYVAVIGGARLFGVPQDLLDVVIVGAGLPLWFLAAYTLCQAVVPVMAGFHARAPRATLVVLLAAAIGVDAVRFATHGYWIGNINLFFVWVLIQQLGFWYADGWFAARKGWQLLSIAAACYALLALITFGGPYDTDMLAMLNPPTVCLVLLGLAQACLLRLVRPALARLMGTKSARAVVYLVGSRLMTIYLWHLPLIIALSGLALLIPGAAPQPASPAWWWTRPLFYVVVLVALFGLSFLVARWEAPREIGATPPASIVVLAVALTFIPAYCVLQWGLDFPFALMGAAFFGGAVLLLGRWKSRSRTLQPA